MHEWSKGPPATDFLSNLRSYIRNHTKVQWKVPLRECLQLIEYEFITLNLILTITPRLRAFIIYKYNCSIQSISIFSRHLIIIYRLSLSTHRRKTHARIQLRGTIVYIHIYIYIYIFELFTFLLVTTFIH